MTMEEYARLIDEQLPNLRLWPQHRVTSEMAAAHAQQAYCESGDARHWPQHPVSDPCLVPNPFADLTRQRDEARANEATWRDAAERLSIDRDAWSAKCAEQATEMDRLRMDMAEEAAGYEEMLSAKNAWADRALLAEKCLAAFEPTPEPAPNPFREHRGDPRRIGG